MVYSAYLDSMFSRDSASLALQVFVLIGLVCLVAIGVRQRREIRALQQAMTQVSSTQQSMMTTTTAPAMPTSTIAVGEPNPADFTCGKPASLLRADARLSLDEELRKAGWRDSSSFTNMYVCVRVNQPIEPLLAVTNDCVGEQKCYVDVIQLFDPVSKTLSPIAREVTSEMYGDLPTIEKILFWSNEEVRYRVQGRMGDGGCSEAQLASTPWFVDKRVNLRTYEQTTTQSCYQRSCASAATNPTDLRCE